MTSFIFMNIPGCTFIFAHRPRLKPGRELRDHLPRLFRPTVAMHPQQIQPYFITCFFSSTSRD